MPAELRRVKRGRGGNPARRFLIWALIDGALLSQVAVARRIGVTAAYVNQVLTQLRRGDHPEKMAAWLSTCAALKQGAD
ncbi:MAG: hypothetical protein ACI9U2_003163 [Bradymonadia bacterium]|jgi:hypothetical protein